jgi:hypothetical protein
LSFQEDPERHPTVYLSVDRDPPRFDVAVLVGYLTRAGHPGCDRPHLRGRAHDHPARRVEVEYRNAGELTTRPSSRARSGSGDRGVRYEAPDAETTYRGFRAGIRLASLIT